MKMILCKDCGNFNQFGKCTMPLVDTTIGDVVFGHSFGSAQLPEKMRNNEAYCGGLARWFTLIHADKNKSDGDDMSSSSLYKAIKKASEDLPEGYEATLHFDKGNAWIDLETPDGHIKVSCADSLEGCIEEAVRKAIDMDNSPDLKGINSELDYLDNRISRSIKGEPFRGNRPPNPPVLDPKHGEQRG